MTRRNGTPVVRTERARGEGRDGSGWPRPRRWRRAACPGSGPRGTECWWRGGHRGWRRRAGRDRGSSVVELAVLAPVLMMLCMLIIQFGLWFNARQVALAAAQAGATVARQEAFSNPSWGGDARGAAIQYYRNLHTHLLNGPAARPWGNRATSVYVTVTGRLSYHLFPFFPLSLGISATAGGPVECFRPATTGGTAC